MWTPRLSGMVSTVGMLILAMAISSLPLQAALPDVAEIQRLIDQLGSKDEAARSKAEKRLESIGEPALEFLQQVADSKRDFEVRLRADRVAELIMRSFEIRRMEGHQNTPMCVAFSPDGTQALSGGWDHSIRLWDLKTGKQLRQLFGHTATVWSVAFSSDGHRALSASGTLFGSDNAAPSDCTIRLWDVDSGNELRRLEGHTKAVRGAVFLPDGQHVLSGGEDRTLRLWDLESGRELRRFEGHTNHVLAVAVSPDGRFGLSGSGVEEKDGKGAVGKDNTARLWDLQTGKEVRRFEGHTSLCISVAFSRDGRRILTGSWDETIRLWDVATGKELRRFEGHMAHVEKIAFSPDGRRALSVGYDHTMRLWDVTSGRQLLCYRGHTYDVMGVAYSRDGRRALSSSGDRTVRLWKVPQFTKAK
jgi:WD40 repeat protein